VAAAVTIAAHNVMTAYFPAAPTLDGARDTDLAAIPNGPAKTAGMAVGMAA
jgi:hypothetical protein